PWSTGYDRDQFAVELTCTVEENELLAGQLTIRRLRRSRAAQEVVQAFRIGPGPGAASPLFTTAPFSELPPGNELFTGTNSVSYAAHHERMAVR
ncbi:MAG: hypothetical protein LC772_07200, partial [Chloroflexi bacterium]|nr:hypothetical protein [Chloroflexota bacterium]